MLSIGNGELLFPSIRSAHRPMSDNTLLRRLGYAKDEVTATASAPHLGEPPALARGKRQPPVQPRIVALNSFGVPLDDFPPGAGLRGPSPS